MSQLQPSNSTAKVRTFNAEQMLNILAGLVATAIIVLGGVFLIYFQAFHNGFSSKQEVWGQFGDFVGGVSNPILSFLSLIALIFTVALQSRQLELAHAELQNSKAELEATREELTRSADAQRLTANALEEQAKYAVVSAQLAALRAALEVSSEDLRQAQNNGRSEKIQESLDRKKNITEKILLITEQLCSLPEKD